MRTFYIQYDLEYHNYPKFIIVNAECEIEAIRLIISNLEKKQLCGDWIFIENNLQELKECVFIGDW